MTPTHKTACCTTCGGADFTACACPDVFAQGMNHEAEARARRDFLPPSRWKPVISLEQPPETDAD